MFNAIMDMGLYIHKCIFMKYSKKTLLNWTVKWVWQGLAIYENEYEYKYLIITWVRVRVRVLVEEYEYEYRHMIHSI